jgi:hypothetical protein
MSSSFKTFRWLVLSAAIMMHAQAAQAVMLARYTLDDDVNGLINQGADAESNLIAAPNETGITGAPTYSATGGVLGGYAIFTGNQALVAKDPGNVADDLAGYPFTISAWIRPTLVAGRGAAVGMINSAANDQYYSLGIEQTSGEANDLQAVRRNPTFTSTKGANTKATIFDGNWHHIAVSNPHASKSRLYLDGVEVGISSATVNFSAALSQLSIGGMRRLSASTPWIDKYNGHVDEVSIFNEALVPEQIQFIKNNVGVAPASVAPCDVNVSGGCTIDDLQIIANNFYTAVPFRNMGDLNEDGFVNFADYRVWKDTSGSGATLADVMGNVPEPASIVLISLALGCLGVRRGKR